MAGPVDRAERLTNLLALLLSTAVPITFDDVVNQLVGQYPENRAARHRAFERDKATLRDIGVPIETEVLGGHDAGRTGYRIDRARYELADLDLSADETHALQVAVAAIRSGTPIGTDALLKLGTGGTDDDSAVWANVPSLDALPALREAVATRRAVRFDYRDVERHVDPWGLALRDGFWYVVGFDHDRRGTRTFRADRIAGTVALDGGAAFDRPDVDVAVLLPDDPKSLGADDRPAEAQVALDMRSGAARAALEELGGERVRERSGQRVDVDVPCANRAAFRSWVLGLLDAAEVVGPADVRDDVVAWLDAEPAIDVNAATRAAGAARRRQTVPPTRRRVDERVRRMLIMLPWLAERGSVPLDEVASRFHLDADEVERDIAWVSMCGLPPFVHEMIDVFVDEGMVHVGVPRLFTRPLRLTAPEGFALLTAGRAAMALPGADPAGPLGRGLAKLEAVLGGGDEGAVVVDLARPAIADDLADAVRRVERLELAYWSAGSDETTVREVTPRRLFADRGHWYLRADDHRSGGSRTFRVDRIERHRRLGENDEPVEAPLDEEWFADASIPRVTLCVLPAAFWIAERYPTDEVTDAKVGRKPVRFVRLAVTDERWLARLLVRLGPDALVVEPVEWRDVAGPVRRGIRARYR